MDNILPVKVFETLTACVQCGACSHICPAGVQIDTLIRSARAKYAEGFPVPWWLWNVIKSRRLLPLLTKLLAFMPVTSGLIWRLIGLSGHISVNKEAFNFRLPSIVSRPALSRRNFRLLDPKNRIDIESGPRIALFLGCVQNYLYPQVAEAMIQWFGGKVLVPQGQMCCGLPAWSGGAWEMARELAIKNLETFENAKPDFILTGCASCASMIKNWPKLFSDGDPDKKIAINLATKVREFSQLVTELGILPFGKKRDISAKVTYHAPCHQRFDLGGAEVSEKLLDSIFSDAFRPMPHECCGQGGLFSITNPKLAWEIFEKRLSALERTGASIVVTTCSGCLLQWRAGTANQAHGPRVLHLAESVQLIK